MSLVENLKARANAKAPSPAEILAELKIAEAEVSRLEAQHGAAALDAFSREPGSERRLKTSTASLQSGGSAPAR